MFTNSDLLKGSGHRVNIHYDKLEERISNTKACP